jgi:hypothetical protein
LTIPQRGVTGARHGRFGKSIRFNAVNIGNKVYIDACRSFDNCSTPKAFGLFAESSICTREFSTTNQISGRHLKKQSSKNHYKNSGVNVTTLSIMGESVKIMANLSTPRAMPAAAGMVTTSRKKRSDIGYTDLFIERRYP